MIGVIDMQIGSKLRELRIKNGFSQQTLANKAGVSISGLRFWEANARVPKLQIIKRLCDALDCTIEDLYSE